MITSKVFAADLLAHDFNKHANTLFMEFVQFDKPEAECLNLAGATITYLQRKTIVLYGAGIAGEHFYNVLKHLNITPLCYFDKNAKRIGSVCSLPVYDPDRIKEMWRDDWVIIVSVNAIQTSLEIIGLLKRLGISSPILNGRYLIRLLNYPVCARKHNALETFDILKCQQCGVDVIKCPFFTAFLQRESGYDSRNASGSRKFDWCGYILGQVCTLKCECCCESIPFIRGGTFVNADVAIADIQKLAEACQYLERLEFVGGEPFLHPDLGRILTACLKMNKVGYIYVFTNGSIIPDDETCRILSHPRIILQISNYTDEWPKKIHNNTPIIKKKFADFGIKYVFIENSEWVDISGFDPNNLPEESLKAAFAQCFINHCHRLYNGILYRCPHQYAGIQTNKLAPVDGQIIDINSLTNTELAAALDRIEELQFLASCGHCSIPVGPQKVPAGKQHFGYQCR